MKVNVKVLGVDKTIKRIERLEHLDTNPIFKRHVRNAGENTRSFWKRDVYKVYNKRLSHGLPISNDFKNSIRISSKDPFNIKISRVPLIRESTGISGGPTNGKDYGDYILYGTNPGRGLYSYYYDKKLTHGTYAMSYTPGVRRSLGQRWLSQFNRYTDNAYQREYEQAIIDIMEEE